MMRRAFLRALAVSGITSLPVESKAELTCGPFVPPGVQQCRTGIDSSVAAMHAKYQKSSEWCWAASISMIFDYYDHPVSQERIVKETWGGILNLPGQPRQILADLNRVWTDDNGDDFTVVATPFNVNPITAAQDLSQDKPLIIGALGHATVLTALTYVRDMFGNGQVIAATVRDPWPGQGVRILSPQEWYSIMFAARIRVN